MRKKKLLGGFLATVLTLSTISTGVLADNHITSANATGTANGAGTVFASQDVYDVLLPSNLNYAVDTTGTLSGQMQPGNGIINVGNGAVYSASFGVINHSSVPLSMDVSISATTTASVDLLTAGAIAANNAATDSTKIATKAALSLSIAPLASGSSVTQATDVAVGNVSMASVTFDAARVSTKEAVAITGGASKLSFVLKSATYETTTAGVEFLATNAGFMVSAAGTGVVTLDKEYKGDGYDTDPVVGFTIIGDANKQADWTDASITLPAITATFTFKTLTELEYNDVEFAATYTGTSAGCGLVASESEGNATEVAIQFLSYSGQKSFFIASDNGTAKWDDDITIPSLSVTGTVAGNTTSGTVTDAKLVNGYICISVANLVSAGVTPSDTAGTVYNITFTLDGINYTATCEF